MNTPTLYRLEVAPLIILPLSRSPLFTYASPDPISTGSLVSVSFGPQTIQGVVFDCQVLPGNKPTWMKLVSHVIEKDALTQQQRLLALQVSREYFTPLGKTLKHFLSKRVSQRKKTEEVTNKKVHVLRATKKEFVTLEKISSKHPFCFFDTTQDIDPLRLYALLIKQSLAHKKQILFLVPEITLVFPLVTRLGEYSRDLTVLHSQLSSGAFSTAWEKIRSGEAGVIIATRQGLFAPFKSLGTIVLTEEQDESYKQWDMSPRYHSKQVAVMLATLHQAILILSSSTPSTESLFLLAEKKLTPLVPLVPHAALGNTLTIVNLKLERYRKNFSPLSEALAQALRETLGKGGQALLYINRQGLNAFSVCDQCKNTFRCVECNHPLGSTKDGRFRCTACGYTTPLFPSCPTCGNLTFRHIGFGTERVEREVRKLLPHARIFRLDSTTSRLTPPEILYQKGLSGEIDILIGTQMILKDPPLPKLSLVAMIDADSLLLFPHFRADERLFQDLSRAVHQVTNHPKNKPGGRVFIQTFHPESAFLQKIATLKSSDILTSILTDRKELSYPPFFRFLTLICQGKSEKSAQNKAEALRIQLQEKLPKTYRVRQSSTVRFLKKQSLFESDLLLRFPATNDALSETLVTLLRDVSKDCIIDVDPLTPK